MGFRFRRSVKLLPGVRLNVSGSGVSTSFGGRGASITVGHRGVRANVGMPGTGLSYSERLDAPADRRAVDDTGAPRRAGSSVVTLVLALVAFGSCAAVLGGS